MADKTYCVIEWCSQWRLVDGVHAVNGPMNEQQAESFIAEMAIDDRQRFEMQELKPDDRMGVQNGGS